MSIRNLEFLFRPRSVAVIGASNRPASIGATVMRNVLAGGFEGPVWPVVTRNPIRIGWRVLTSPLPAINWEEREIVGCRWRGSCG